MKVLVDQASLANFLRTTVPEFEGRFEIARIGEGQSCLTFSVTGEDWEIVLRRPPRGELAPGAHDVGREFRVLEAVWKNGGVPVARPIVFCGDTDVIGAPFYLMERVDGVVIRDHLPPQFDDDASRRGIGEELVDVLADLHSIDVESAGLSGLGKPGPFLERHLRRIMELSEQTRTRKIPAQEDLSDWLNEHRPDDRPSHLIHGDFKLDNVIFGPSAPPRVAALIDWEIATIADPLVDLGWLLYFWYEDETEFDIKLPVASVMTEPGFMNRHEMLELYVERTGAETPNIRWYVVLAGWKISIIMESSYRRYLAGDADHESFAALEHDVVALAERAQRFAHDELSL